jgi:hypothetical protein
MDAHDIGGCVGAADPDCVRFDIEANVADIDIVIAGGVILTGENAHGDVIV